MLPTIPRPRFCIRGLVGCLLFAVVALRLGAQTDQPIYTDSLQNGWQDYGWATRDYASTAFVHSGSKAIGVTVSNYTALYLGHANFDSSSFTNLTFWINGGTTGGQKLNVQAELNGTAQTVIALPVLAANTWQQIILSLNSLGVAGKPNFSGVWIQDRTGGAQPTFYVDDVALIATPPLPLVTNAPVTITVNASLNRHPISPLIYGVAFASSNQLADLNAPLNRSGGNSETRYNWQTNAHNHAADFYFESIVDSPPVAGAAGDSFVHDTKAGGAEPILTISMIGWVAKPGPGGAKTASYSIAKYGPQTGNDAAYFPDAGNGIRSSDGSLITTNDPADANVLTDSTFQQSWVEHLTNHWGLSINGGVRYYCMDNEHTIWHSTHRDVHPVGTTMQEIRDKLFDYAARVKAVDPSALVLGPEEWGWPGYLYSGYDQQWSGAHNDYNTAHYPDRGTNGGWDYLPWLLDQLHQRATSSNQRLLDVFTVHFYPQGGEFGDDVSTATQLLRNRSTRSLWDTNYVDTSWINSVVKLIPRLQGWVAAYYPGTKTGITEYNWGAETNINGATAQADILGIFGRESLDYGTRWTTPTNTTPTYKAMKLFRNYDGNKSTFGDVSISASGPNPDNVASFASIRSADGAMTVLAINKQLDATAPVNIALTNFFPGGTAQVWQLTSANAITRLADLSFTGAAVSNSLPPQSITLFVLPAGITPHLRPGAASPGGTFDFWLDGQANQRYAIQSCSDYISWQPVQTNLLAGASLHVVLPVTNIYRFYRAEWLP